MRTELDTDKETSNYPVYIGLQSKNRDREGFQLPGCFSKQPSSIKRTLIVSGFLDGSQAKPTGSALYKALEGQKVHFYNRHISESSLSESSDDKMLPKT